MDGLVCADLALVSGSAVVNEPLGLFASGVETSGCWEMLKKDGWDVLWLSFGSVEAYSP